MRVIAIVTGCMLAGGLNTAALGMASTAGTGTDTSVAAVQGTAVAAKKDTSKRVCRMLTPTGSRLPLRSCRTQQEWDAEAARFQKDADAQRRNDETVRPGAFTKNF